MADVPYGLDVSFEPHGVTIRDMPIREARSRFGLSLLLGGDLPVWGYVVLKRTLRIDTEALWVGDDRWNLADVDHLETTEGGLRVWVRTGPGELKRVELAADWPATTQAWLAELLVQAIGDGREAAPPPLPAALQRILDRG